mgnify:CR=1 FL=1
MHFYTYQMKKAKSRKKATETVSFVASTSSPDRYSDIVDQKGWNLSAYKKNPVILLNHDSSQLPIGKGNVHIKNDQLVIDVQFDDQDPKAQEVKRKAQNGFMNAVSVGFRPIESISRFDLPKDNKYYGTKGTYFAKAELLEVSIVTIPANGEATMLEKKYFNNMKNDLVNEMRQIIREELDNQYKHILNVKQEDDKYIIEFAKAEMEMEEDAMKEEEEEEKEIIEEEDDEKYHDKDSEDKELEDEEEEKNYIESLTEAFAYILHS